MGDLVRYSNERKANPNLPPPPGVTVIRRDGSTEGAPVNPMGMAMAGMAAAKAGATPFQSKPMKIADSFTGTTAQPTQKPESGYKVVG